MQGEAGPASTVGEALAALGHKEWAAGAVQVGDAFTDVPGADLLVKREPNAFLLGVLFTQGIRAERAWAAPFLLRERLGHLDMVRLATDPAAVAKAVSTPPALHRFVKTMPGWVSRAAERVVGEYSGDAARIWPHGGSVLEVTKRLTDFDGIGRKKAAMAVEILVRHFRVPLVGLEHGTVAYDVHVRRVFLRSGLAEADDPGVIAEAARAAYPEEPGVLDLPAWLIGREWCRPRSPRCDACPLGAVCARRTHMNPAGVGGQSRARMSRPDSSLG